MNLQGSIEAAVRGVMDPDTELDIMRMKLIRHRRLPPEWHGQPDISPVFYGYDPTANKKEA